MPRFDVACEVCGKAFSAYRPANEPPRFCSHRCKGESQRGRAWGLGIPGGNRPKPKMPKHNTTTQRARERLAQHIGRPFSDALRVLYVERQESIGTIAKAVGTTHRTVKTWLAEAGIPQRTLSECRALDMARMSTDQIAARTRAAHDAVRGQKQTDEHRQKIAQTIQARCRLSDDERQVLAAYQAAGRHPIPLLAIHRYNIDFAFPDAMLAVEYNGGNWHESRRKREADRRKAEYLAGQGWRILTFSRIAKPEDIHRIVEETIAHLNQVSDDPSGE